MELDQHPVRLCGHQNLNMQQRKPGTGGLYLWHFNSDPVTGE